jgi:hypothetical protein
VEAGAEYDATELMLANGPFDLDILIDQVTMCACVCGEPKPTRTP